MTAFMTKGGLGRGCHCKVWKILKRPSQRQHCLHICDFYHKVLQSWLPLERFVAFFCKVLIMVIYQRTNSFFMTLTYLKTQMFLMKVMGNLTLMIWMTVSVYPSFVFIRVTFSSSLRPYIFLTIYNCQQGAIFDGRPNNKIKARVQNKIKKHMPEIAGNYIHLAQYKVRLWLSFVLSRSFMIIWDCCCCISVNIFWKFCICSCCCLVCCSMTSIKSLCCFFDCSSFLLSASSCCLCSCISSIFHFCTRLFFSRKYAIVSLPLLQHFALAAVSLSTPSFLCLFCVLPRFSRALYLISAALAFNWHSFCHFALFLQPQLLFLVSPQVLFQHHSNLARAKVTRIKEMITNWALDC